MKVKGLLNLKTLKEKISLGKINTVIVGFTDQYGRLMGKRFNADFFVESLKSGTHACNYLLTTNMEMDPVPGFDFANWELGYGDFHLVPDMKTLRKANWLKKTAMVLCDVVDDKNHKNVAVAPRSLLLAQVAKAKKAGFDSFAASELEYYLFEDSFKKAHKKSFHNLKPKGWYIEDYHILQGTRNEKFNAAARKHLEKSGVPVENSKGEWGLGQHELNVAYAPILEMGDRHVVYKQCLKELADKQGISLTFMAKFHKDWAGSSCHIHISLWKKGKNAFDGKKKLGPVNCSDTFKWFLGGCIKYTPDIMPFYAPTVNSYKRYADGSWAPTRLAWSYDNRTAGFRVVGAGKSLRIECRIPGADCNPYLAFAAVLATGMEGIKNKIEPPEIFTGDIYAANHLPRVPYSLKEANEIFEKSKFAEMAFGAEVVKHYAHFYRNEYHEFNSAVTDWERKRYFERI